VEARVQTVCLVLISTILTGAALYWLRPVMVPFVLALFITMVLAAVTETLQVRLRVPRKAALAVAITAGILMLAGVAVLVSASVRELTEQAALYNDYMSALAMRVASWAELDLATARGQNEALARIPVSAIGGMLGRTANAVMATLSDSFLVLIFVVFLLVGGMQTGTSGGVWGEAELRIKRYIATKAGTSFATGFLVGLVLLVLDVPLALAFGLFAFLLNFIPSIGSIVATLLPLPVVVVSPEVSTLTAVLAIAVPGLIQISIGNFIEPKIMGESLDLHPAVILLSLILWGMLWGVVGMILAVPIMAVVKITCERFEGSRIVAHVMAGRMSALTGRR